MYTSVYNMIDDHYKTSTLPAALHLRTVDGSPMSSMGKATLHLQIANFEFSHTFIVCEILPETNFFFGTYFQKRYSLSYCWDSDKHLFIQREGSFPAYTKKREHLNNIAVVKPILKIPPRYNSAIPLRIKGHNLKDQVVYFISN